MKVLLVNAPIRELAIQYYPPLGLAYLAATLQGNDEEVAIADMLIDPDIQLNSLVIKYDLVGVYFTTANFEEALKCFKIAKLHGKTTVAGGPHVSLNIKDCMKHTEIDYIVVGEGEKCFSNLVKSLDSGSDCTDIKSLVYRKDKEIIINPLEKLEEDLDRIPFPAFDLLPINKYKEKNADISMVASRGCPFYCKFCVGTLMGRHQYRRRSIKNVVSEMDEIKDRYNFERITFFDDIFTYDRSFIYELCRVMQHRNYQVRFSCETRVDCVDFELLQTMKLSGFDRIFFGIESGSQSILNYYSKNITITQVKEAVANCKSVGISPILSFILGLPEDNEKTLHETIAFATSLDVSDIWFQPFTPFPGTKAYLEVVKEGLIPENTASSDMDNYNLRSIVVGTKYLTKQQIEQIYIRAIMSVNMR